MELLGTLESTEGLQLLGGRLGREFPSVSALLPTPFLSPVVQGVQCSWNSVPAACGSQGGQRGPCPQVHTERPSHLVASLSSMRCPRNLKGQCCFCLPTSFSLFSPFGSQTLKTRTFRSNCVYGVNYKVNACAQGKAQAKKRHEKTLSLNLWLTLLRDSLQL